MSGADFEAAAERSQDRAAGKRGEEVGLAAVLGGDAALTAPQPIAQLSDGLGGADDAESDLLRPFGREVDRTVVHQAEAHVDVTAVGGELEQRFGKMRQAKGAQVAPSPSASFPRRPRSPATVVGDTERQRESRQRGEDERVFAKKVGLTDQEGRPHADVPADALVRFQPLDAAHPVGGVAEFVVAVRREVVGRLDRQIPFAGDPDEVRHGRHHAGNRMALSRRRVLYDFTTLRDVWFSNER